MKILQKITLLVGLATVLPMPQITAGQPAAQRDEMDRKHSHQAQQQPAENSNFGWIMAGVSIAAIIWWNVWGKSWAKKYREKEKKAKEKPVCCLCQMDTERCNLISLHSNAIEHVRNNVPNIDMGARPKYADQNKEQNAFRLRELPKKPEHKVCVDCLVHTFKDSYRTHVVGDVGNDEAGTCLFHTMVGGAHGLCKKCDARGLCLYCPAILVEKTLRDEKGKAISYEKMLCKCTLDIGWVERNNDVHGAINREYQKDHATRNKLNATWTRLVNDYPRMMGELHKLARQDVGGRNTIVNRYNAEWNKI